MVLRKLVVHGERTVLAVLKHARRIPRLFAEVVLILRSVAEALEFNFVPVRLCECAYMYRNFWRSGAGVDWKADVSNARFAALLWICDKIEKEPAAMFDCSEMFFMFVLEAPLKQFALDNIARIAPADMNCNSIARAAAGIVAENPTIGPGTTHSCGPRCFLCSSGSTKGAHSKENAHPL
jgi:hypothetical protein